MMKLTVRTAYEQDAEVSGLGIRITFNCRVGGGIAIM